jgi:hypothetical protein
MSQKRRCRACKAAIGASGSARGRPRVYCVACVPPGAGGAAAWRAVNPERVAAYNTARRKRG